MKTSSRLAVLTIAAVSLCSPALAAKKTPNTPVRLQDVAKQTATLKTMTFSMNSQFSFNVKGKTIAGAIVGSGMTDRAKAASAMTIDMSGFMKSILAGSGQALPPQFADPSLMKMQVISIGTKVWMSYPFLNAMSPAAAGKPWVLLDAAKLGMDAGQIAASQGADPSQGLALLQGIAGDAVKQGTETIDGVQTTKYTATVTASALSKNLSPKQAAELKTVMGANDSIPVSVWIDGENRARRLDVSMNMANQGMNMAMATSYFFSKFNEPVSISAPPASQVGENPLLTQAILGAQQQKKKAA